MTTILSGTGASRAQPQEAAGGPVAMAPPVIGDLYGDRVRTSAGGTAVLLDLGSDATVSGENLHSLFVRVHEQPAGDLLGVRTVPGEIELSDGMNVGSIETLQGSAYDDVIYVDAQQLQDITHIHGAGTSRRMFSASPERRSISRARPSRVSLPSRSGPTMPSSP